MSKVILIDSSGIFVPTVKVVDRIKMQNAKAGKGPFDGVVMQAHAMYFTSLLSAFKKIGLNKEDTVIIAEEGHSWRKNYAAFYKDHREGLRDKDKFTNWPEEYRKFNKLHDQLRQATNWYFIREKDLEADDVIAIATRYFKDQEVIIVTGDKDMHQLCYYPYVKMFNLNKKINGTKGIFEHVKNPIKIVNDKAKNGDEGDNIIPSPNDTEEDYNLRYFLVNLLSLPPEIEAKGIAAITEALKETKQLNLKYLPEFKDVEEKFLKIYNKDKVVTYEQCVNLIEKRIAKKKEKANVGKTK